MHFDGSILVGAPPADVFALLAEVQDHAVGPGSPVTAMEKIPPGPTRVGTRWREVVSVMPGLTLEVWSEVTRLEPDRRLEERFWGSGMRGTLVYSLTPSGRGCLLRQQESMQTEGALRLIGLPWGWMLRWRLVGRLREIRDAVEDGTG